MRKVVPTGWVVAAVLVASGLAFAGGEQQAPTRSATDADTGEAPRASLDRLESLPYVDARPDRHSEKRGVLYYDRERAWPGYNLFYSRRLSTAQLLDMDGRQVYRWSYPPGAGSTSSCSTTAECWWW